MFAQVYQSGLVSLLYSVGCVCRSMRDTTAYALRSLGSRAALIDRNKPLQLWEKCEETPSRSITRVLDNDIQSSVIELSSTASIVHTWLRCPASAGANDSSSEAVDERQTSLHLRLPHLVLLLKPLHDQTTDTQREVSIEVHVRDARQQLRRFRASTFQRRTVVHPLITLLPLQLDAHAWNQLQFDLAQLTRDAYNTTFAHAVSVQLHANCRVRRVYFTDAMVPEQQLPVEFRLYTRLSKAQVAAYKALDESERAQQ